jgi:nucleotide-binding universal stress UspA family protein
LIKINFSTANYHGKLNSECLKWLQELFREENKMYKKILFAADGSEYSIKAASYAADLGKRYNAEIILFHGFNLPEHFNAHKSSHYGFLREAEEKMTTHGNALLDTLKKELEAKDIKVKTILTKGAVGPSIVEKAAAENCDLIIIGSRGVGNITGLLIGSTSNYVIHNAKCPVLLIH